MSLEEAEHERDSENDRAASLNDELVGLRQDLQAKEREWRRSVLRIGFPK